MAAQKLLLVDDIEANLVALEAILESPDREIFTAQSGAEALALANNNSFAAIILDVMMPEMDGFETAKCLREMPLAKAAPILFLTAVDKDPALIAKGYEAGGVDYMIKPIDHGVLNKKIDTFLKIYGEKHVFEKLAQTTSQTIKELEDRLRTKMLELERQSHKVESLLGFIEQERCSASVEVKEHCGDIFLGLLDKIAHEFPGLGSGVVREVQSGVYSESHKLHTDSACQLFAKNRMRLTMRELEICQLIRTGASTKDVSSKLGLSVKTVESHRKHIRKKLEIQGRGANLVSFLSALSDELFSS